MADLDAAPSRPTRPTRGKASYDLFCASCHGEDLAGQNGPALKGARFLSIWDAATLREFYRKVSTTMPRAQARLDEAVYLDVIAYVLQQNGFPTGPRELTAQPDDARRASRSSAPTGPWPPRTANWSAPSAAWRATRADGC